MENVAKYKESAFQQATSQKAGIEHEHVEHVAG